ncbi:ATP-grasp domain-containing protein [Floridanema evergladense]|uniref:RimK family alpha-L-glutamate ligase n=1 Tax=Floridaenema evergladense BLCC-F167 TaxID=3153639 RepID=A0ABV4WMH0_9CYAN
MFNNLRILLLACENLNIKYEIITPNGNLIKVKLHKDYYFCNSRTPLIDEAVSKILQDKEYTYYLLKEKIKIPQTIGFLSPHCNEQYKSYLKCSSITEMMTEIKTNFALPVIVKRNSGSRGHNVFLCHTDEEIETALKVIFDLKTKGYDDIALAQQYILSKSEYRAIYLYKELVLLYEKNVKKAKFIGNLSPLHWQGAEAKYINDLEILAEIDNFVRPIFTTIDLDYGGLDIVIDSNNNYWLIEINSHPSYSIFIRDNGDEQVIKIFEKMLIKLANQ